MENEVQQVSLTSVAQALATDYFCIYYINVDTKRFIEYSASPEYKEFGLPTSGDDLISFARNSFEKIIWPEDQERFLRVFTKETVIRSLDEKGHFTITFRMMFRGVPTFVLLKMTRMIEEEGHHAVIGISSVDEQMKARQAEKERITYGRVAQALAGDYFSIYVVNPDTDRFVAYSSTRRFDELGVEKAGEDFFTVSRKNMNRLIYDEDRDRFMGIFTKEKIMSILERDGSFTMKYRLMFGSDPVFVSMKATLLEDEDGRHLIIGTNNIDAQMKREEEYRRRMAEARTSARNDFLANMSHDIRTPMNAIVGYTNIAKNHIQDPSMVQNALEKIGSSSHFLLSLINDILDISKIESDRMQLSKGECSLADVLRRIEDITALQASSKSLQISYQHDSVRHYRVIADELRIEQILINIISNAIKYTPEGESVKLIAEEETTARSGWYRYRFIIRDTGIGISEEYLPYIFESFTREEKTTVNRIQGTGLGLAITARIVELMGGTISVKSKPGEGSEFTVELDLETCSDPVPDEDASLAGTGGMLSGCRVLLVEDNVINAEIADMILTQYGIKTDLAENGQIGVRKIQAQGPGYYDAVLMDIQMPVMNGYEAARAIRALEGDYYRTIPIIAISANAYDEDVEDCLAAGMNAHLAKPFQPDGLYGILHEQIHKK